MAKAPSRTSVAVPNTRSQRVSQADVPAHTLEEALKVAEALSEYAFKPTAPLDLASAMDMSPSSSTFRTLTGAAIAYGLTEGGCYAGSISIQAFGKSIIDSTDDDARLGAKRNAVLKPKVVNRFLSQYDGRKLPKPETSYKVLSGLGVPDTATKRVLGTILANAKIRRFLTRNQRFRIHQPEGFGPTPRDQS